MSLIYTPKGKAREYSPLALNIYSGCDHQCEYCYVRKSPYMSGPEIPVPRKDILTGLKKELESRPPITDQVLLSFTGDPYCKAEEKYGITRQVLELMLEHQVPVAILTKGGTRCLRDIDLFKQFDNIKVGATLTFNLVEYSDKWEPLAESPNDRKHALMILHDLGIRTWVSIEPVISPKQSLSLIHQSLPYVDQYKVGRWNHDARANLIDWKAFGTEAVRILREAGKDFYVKKDLAVHLDGLTPEETNMDRLALKRGGL
jgi:DNA repair photolyase